MVPFSNSYLTNRERREKGKRKGERGERERRFPSLEKKRGKRRESEQTLMAPGLADASIGKRKRTMYFQNYLRRGGKQKKKKGTGNMPFNFVTPLSYYLHHLRGREERGGKTSGIGFLPAVPTPLNLLIGLFLVRKKREGGKWKEEGWTCRLSSNVAVIIL